jgi:outer membrane protein OmpA-like peptidoglycan-associated protein
VRPFPVLSGGALAFAALCAWCISRHASMGDMTAAPPPPAIAPALTPPPAVVAPTPAPAAERVAAAIADRLTGKTIEFETSSAVITPRGRAILDSLVPVLASEPNTRFEVAGHTDQRGNPQRNHELSERRAASVKQYLIERGIAGERLQPAGYGATKLLTTETTPDALRRNRRIEFTPLPER